MLRRTILVLVSGFVIAGCGASPSPSLSSSLPSTLSPAPSVEPTALPLSGLFDVGGGRKLHLECIGAGSPTIVIEVGNDDTIHGSWGAVFGPMAAVSRVCAYDRANTGRSDPAPGPRLISDLADDLFTVLQVANVPGPYVFVGGSFGGNIVSIFAATHPEVVAGIVLVDSTPANDDPAFDPLRINLTAEQYAAWSADQLTNGPPAWDSPNNIEHIDFPAGLAAELASVHALPRVPTSVITASRQDCEPGWPCEAIAASVARLEAQWIAGNPNGTRVIVQSGHVMQREAPRSIVDATRLIVEAIRAGT